MHFHVSTQLIIAALLAGGISAAACIMRMLTISGAIAAFAVGFVIFGLGGAAFAIPLLAFFVSSSVLSFIGSTRKRQANANYEKSATRDAGQVLANGLIPAILAVAFSVLPQTRLVALLYIAALAAVNADTWATEIGGLSSNPRLVTTFKQAEAGTSGAVSVAGFGAAALGSVFILLVGWLSWPERSVTMLWRIDAPEMIAVGWSGFLAAYADSLLGATLQAQYRCKRCSSVTERAEHCGVSGNRVRGLAWVNNDVVNFAASALGAFIAWLMLRFYAYPI